MEDYETLPRSILRNIERFYQNLDNGIKEMLKEKLITSKTTVKELQEVIANKLSE